MSLQLLVGLANPGELYQETRHNAGAWFIENLARRFAISLREESKFEGLFVKFQGSVDGLGQVDTRLLIPLTYMNASGRSVSAATSFFKIPPEDLLIVHDEMDLPVGTVRLKFGGGHGGHNGLRDVIAAVGENFWRLRIGIGHPGSKDQVLNYVLHPPGKSERALIDEGLKRVESVLPDLLGKDLSRAMSILNRS
jgi:peptidyl-tRNA hydrolase, PTH1 family